jgi:glycine amidinotransferase
MRTPVSSYSEWQPLEEVILGAPYHFNNPSDELSFRVFFHDNIFGYSWRRSTAETDRQSIDYQRHIDEMAEDLDAIQGLLQAAGIQVRRPARLDGLIPFSTPYWSSNCVPSLNVRDLTMIVGNEIIETPVQVRCRYFENDLLKPIFYNYFCQGAKWTSAPRPMLLDNSIDLSYVSAHGATSNDYQAKPHRFDLGYEIMFDAAQCVRLGRDIIFNVSTENHRLGAKWLQQHLGEPYRIHTVQLTDNHIDSSLVPLRPGCILLRASRKDEVLPTFLKKWDAISVPPPPETSFPIYTKDVLTLASNGIDNNVLSIDEEHIFVNETYTTLINELERRHFVPIPIKLRHRRIFGGGIHCMTLDIRRRGALEDYG